MCRAHWLLALLLEDIVGKHGSLMALSRTGKWRQSIEALQDSVCQGVDNHYV